MSWRTVVISQNAKLDYQLGYLVVRGQDTHNSVKIEENTGTLFSRLIDYMKLISSYIGAKILTLVNIKSYLSENELIELYQSVSYNKIQLLLIESVERKLLSNEDVCIVDSDKCIINKHTNITP